jgi:4-amino-4-deoxy-L-arabinose transferase-like glycosyltransferase
VYMVMYARLAESDMLLLAFVMAAMTVFFEVETRHKTLTPAQLTRLRLVFWLLVGCANLAKGLAFGSVLICFTCGGWLVLKRDWSAIRRWFSPLGIILAAGIAVAWPLAVIMSDPTALELWKRHLFGRAAGTLGYTQPVWYYLVQWPTQLLPWTPFLFVAGANSWKAAYKSAGADRFCWWWFLGQMAILSCSSGKHHHYLIYALPAMSPIISQGLILTAEAIRNPLRSWNRANIVVPCLAGLVIVGGIVLGVQQSKYRIEGFLLLPALGLALCLLALQIQQRAVRPIWATALALIVGGHIYAQVIVMPRVDTSAADRQFLAEVDQHVGQDAVLSACGSQEMALHIFYLHHPVTGIWDPANLPAAFPGVHDFYVVARGQAQKELESLGKVEQVLQSRFTRRERSVADRFTLFHVSQLSLKSPPVVAEKITAVSLR